MGMAQDKLLEVYLDDHLAGALGGLELAKRCQANNNGTALGDFLNDLIAEIEQDRSKLESIMASMGAPQNPAKQAAAWLAEKVGRLKPNAQLTGYSDLSRLVELEALCLGVEGERALWTALGQVKEHYPELADVDLANLSSREIGRAHV